MYFFFDIDIVNDIVEIMFNCLLIDILNLP